MRPEASTTLDDQDKSVLGWFDENGIEFVRGVPSVTPTADPLDSNLFEPRPRGTAFEHAVAQAHQVVTGNREGGLFLIIGHKPDRHGSTPSAAATHQPDLATVGDPS